MLTLNELKRRFLRFIYLSSLVYCIIMGILALAELTETGSGASSLKCFADILEKLSSVFLQCNIVFLI